MLSLFSCYKLSEKEIEAFLNHVHIESDGSSAATAELLR